MFVYLYSSESEWTPGVGDEQGGLACWDSWGAKSRTWLSDWSDLIWSDDIFISFCLLRNYSAEYIILGTQLFLNCLLEMLLNPFSSSIFALVYLFLFTLAFLHKWSIISHDLLQLAFPFLWYLVYNLTKICLRISGLILFFSFLFFLCLIIYIRLCTCEFVLFNHF